MPRWFWWILGVWIAAVIGGALNSAFAAPAHRYQRFLTAEVHRVWGLDGPVALAAAQIDQESKWNPRVCSPYACGLSQFTPSTAEWMGREYPGELGLVDRFNPDWAIRALVLYDWHLREWVTWAESECERWAFTLSAYNGGQKYLIRERLRCAESETCDTSRWFGNVAWHRVRGKGPYRENRAYVRKIMLELQPGYADWGPQVTCQ